MRKCITLILFVLITIAGASADNRYVRQYFTTSRADHIVLGGAFEYRFNSSGLQFRHATGPADEPFQQVAVNGAIERVAATADRLYVWTEGDGLVAFTVGADGPEAVGVPLPADDASALAALNPAAPAKNSAISAPSAEVVINPQRLFVANSDADSISVIDTVSNSVLKTISLSPGDAPVDVAVMPDNSKAVTANFGCPFCIDRGLSAIDADRMEVVGRYTPAQFPYKLAISRDGMIYAADGPDVKVFAPTGGLSGQVPIGVTVQDIAVAPDGTLFIVCSSSSGVNKVSVVAQGALAPRANWPLPSGSQCVSAGVSPDGRKLYVGCLAGPKLFVLDTATGNTLNQFFTTAAFSLIVSPDGSKLYTARADAGALEILDAATGARLQQIQTLHAGAGLAINFSRNRAWMSMPTISQIAAIDLSANSVLANIPVGRTPIFISLTTPAPEALAAPANLTFTVAAGQPAPAAQNVALSVAPAGAYTFSAVANTQSGGDWLRVSPVSGSTLPATLSATVNPAGIAPGLYSGTIRVTFTGGVVNSPLNIPVTLRITASGTIALSTAELAFEATTGGAAPPSRTVQITGSGSAPLSWSAATTPNTPWLSVSPPAGSTPGTLTVSVNPQGLSAGRREATVTITSVDATNSPQTFRVVLNVTSGPSVPGNGVVNGASYAERAAVAPGSLISIFGTNFGVMTPVSATALPLPTSLGNVSLTIGGRAAPLVFVSSTQINAQVPFEMAGQTSASLVVTSPTGSSSPVTIPLAASGPGLFTITLGGRTQGAVLNADSQLNSAQNPARVGDVIQVFGTGQGAVTNPPLTGAAAGASPLSETEATPVVTIGGVPAEVIFSGLAPGFVGLWQINARIPAAVAPGNSVQVQVQHGNATSNAVLIAVTQ